MNSQISQQYLVLLSASLLIVLQDVVSDIVLRVNQQRLRLPLFLSTLHPHHKQQNHACKKTNSPHRQQTLAQLSQGVSDSLQSSLTSFGHFQVAEYICCNDLADLVCTSYRHLLIVFGYKDYWCLWYINTSIYIHTTFYTHTCTVYCNYCTSHTVFITQDKLSMLFILHMICIHLYMYIILHLIASCISLLMHSRIWICVALFKTKTET